jgi:hypothetical protein
MRRNSSKPVEIEVEVAKAMKIEAEVADSLLDAGVSVPLKAIRLPWRRDKPIVFRFTMRIPCFGNRIRIARLHMKLGITSAEMAGWDEHQRVRFLAEHGWELLRMAALMFLRGKISGYLFQYPVAWMLGWMVESVYIEALWSKFITLLETTSFETTIRSLERTNPLAPMNLSRKKRS